MKLKLLLTYFICIGASSFSSHSLPFPLSSLSFSSSLINKVLLTITKFRTPRYKFRKPNLDWPILKLANCLMSNSMIEELPEEPGPPIISSSSRPEPQNETAVAPDQFDPKWETDKWEIWSYYAYYIGNNGLTLFNFAPTAFQNLLSQASGASGRLRFAGADRTINSIVLLSNGISFAIQIVVFLFLGSFAGESNNWSLPTDWCWIIGANLYWDFGTWRPNILIFLSLIAWGIGFGWLGVHDPSKWQIATGLYIVGRE